MCSFLSLSGKHLVLLAISGVDDVMTLFTSDAEGNVVLRVCGLWHKINCVELTDESSGQER